MAFKDSSGGIFLVLYILLVRTHLHIPGTYLLLGLCGECSIFFPTTKTNISHMMPAGTILLVGV